MIEDIFSKFACTGVGFENPCSSVPLQAETNVTPRKHVCCLSRAICSTQSCGVHWWALEKRKEKGLGTFMFTPFELCFTPFRVEYSKPPSWKNTQTPYSHFFRQMQKNLGKTCSKIPKPLIYATFFQDFGNSLQGLIWPRTRAPDTFSHDIQ